MRETEINWPCSCFFTMWLDMQPTTTGGQNNTITITIGRLKQIVNLIYGLSNSAFELFIKENWDIFRIWFPILIVPGNQWYKWLFIIINCIHTHNADTHTHTHSLSLSSVSLSFPLSQYMYILYILQWIRLLFSQKYFCSNYAC